MTSFLSPQTPDWAVENESVELVERFRAGRTCSNAVVLRKQTSLRVLICNFFFHKERAGSDNSKNNM